MRPRRIKVATGGESMGNGGRFLFVILIICAAPAWRIWRVQLKEINGLVAVAPFYGFTGRSDAKAWRYLRQTWPPRTGETFHSEPASPQAS